MLIQGQALFFFFFLGGVEFHKDLDWGELLPHKCISFDQFTNYMVNSVNFSLFSSPQFFHIVFCFCFLRKGEWLHLSSPLLAYNTRHLQLLTMTKHAGTELHLNFQYIVDTSVMRINPQLCDMSTYRI